MIYLSSVGSEPNLWQKIEDALGIIGNMQTLYSVFAAIVLLVLFWVSVAGFTKNVNAKSLKQVAVFKRNCKYIPELFTELNGNLENLRYFVFFKSLEEKNHLRI